MKGWGRTVETVLLLLMQQHPPLIRQFTVTLQVVIRPLVTMPAIRSRTKIQNKVWTGCHQKDTSVQRKQDRKMCIRDGPPALMRGRAQSDTTDPPEKNKQGQTDESHSDNESADKPPASRDVHNKHDQDANQLKEPADVKLPENSDTEKANNQDRASTPGESGEEAQSGLTPEEASQSNHSDCEGNNEPDAAGVEAQSPEGDQNAVIPLSDSSNTEETNNEDRASPLKESSEKSQSDRSDSEGNEPDQAGDPSQIPEDKQSNLKPAPVKPGSGSTDAAVVSSSSPGAKASLEHDPNPHDNMNNGDTETDQHEKTAKDVPWSDTTDHAEKNKQGQTDESHSDNESADKPPEPKVRAGEVEEPSKENSGSDPDNTETEKTVEDSDSSDN
ncbi:dentin sialophosphoprotein-like [Notolabrus celidotus]|uniref:dentin sialophosphoprotein-like n=1 Tax=Notolabrus celidotus TaxID=1203425 RepID=UPI00148FE953|nr:dentin sialophosphoprotein-like [Notolabrus celidotus]